VSIRPILAAAAAFALSACADGAPAPVSPADTSLDPGLETIAPGAEGLYEGDPLAGPDLDPANDPM